MKQLSIFDYEVECNEKENQAKTRALLTKKTLRDIERSRNYLCTASDLLDAISTEPFVNDGGWHVFTLQLPTKTVYAKLNPDIEMRFRDGDLDGLCLEVLEDGSDQFLLIKNCNAARAYLLGKIPLNEVNEVVETSSDKGMPIYRHPTFKRSEFNAFKALKFEEVFSTERTDSNVFYLNFSKMNLSIKKKILQKLEYRLLRDMRPYYKVFKISSNLYRLDLHYNDIIGGGTVCFFECEDIDKHVITKTVATQPIASSKHNTLLDELRLCTVVNECRIALPNSTLTHYGKIKRLLEESDGIYENNGFYIPYGDAQSVIDNLLKGKKPKSRRKLMSFFATKAHLAKQVCSAVEIKQEHRVAEFHAGHGAIADEVKKAGVEPIVNELWHQNAEILRNKGYKDVLEKDFLMLKPEDIGGKVDCVVGNPPWGKWSEIHHFNHALSFLKSGGSISMLISSSYKTSKSKIAKEFRETLSQHCAEEIDVPKGSFENTDAGGVHVIIKNYSNR